MKQETLEELSPMNDLLQDLKESKVSVKESIDIIEDEFIRGTVNLYVQTTLDNVIARIETELLEKESKWQQERSYSEEYIAEKLFNHPAMCAIRDSKSDAEARRIILKLLEKK